MMLVQVFVNIGGIWYYSSTGSNLPLLIARGNSLLVLSVAIAFVLDIDASENVPTLYEELEAHSSNYM